jgi:hypothetical protein
MHQLFRKVADRKKGGRKPWALSCRFCLKKACDWQDVRNLFLGARVEAPIFALPKHWILVF